MADVVVIGAGMGGLAAAARLAFAGLRVVVLEAHGQPGGKAGTVLVDGVRCDTGPSVLTMPDVVEQLFADCGQPCPLQFLPLSSTFRYRWPDDVVIDVHHAPDDTLASVRAGLGEQAARELEGFLAYAERIWGIAAPAFVYGEAPGLHTFWHMGLSNLLQVRHLDTHRSMRQAVHALVTEPHLRDLLLRYATYNGSDPRRAPGTLNCIAHVELAGGCFGVAGGMGALVDSLVALCGSLGVSFRFDEAVVGIDASKGQVASVRTASATYPTTRVVCNADVAHLARLLPSVKRPSLAPSTSGWTALLRAEKRERPAHEVLFPTRYDAEFEDLFDRGCSPTEPTVYVCAQDRAHGVGNWGDAEPLFVMANAPAVRDEVEDDGVGARALQRLVRAGIAEGPVVWERSPKGLAQAFPDTAGALYGLASNSMFAAFARPANRVPGHRGLYLASGSAHPGGGVPLCLLSGRQAATQLLQDHGSSQ